MSAISIPTKPPATTLLPQPRKQGFTMIEIVLVLVLLGILAAVAIPKYFDLQESGRVKVCEHNRAVIVSTIEKQETLARAAASLPSKRLPQETTRASTSLPPAPFMRRAQ